MRAWLAYWDAELAAWSVFTGLLLLAAAVHWLWRLALRRLT